MSEIESIVEEFKTLPAAKLADATTERRATLGNTAGVVTADALARTIETGSEIVDLLPAG